MPYNVALPPTYFFPSSFTEVIPVTRPITSRLGPNPIHLRVLEMTLEEFEGQDCAIQVRVPWLSETLWFVPTPEKATVLSLEGISRGRIWTTRELRDLLEMDGINLKVLQTLTQIKQEFGAEFNSICRAEHASKSEYSRFATETSANPWPTEITRLGKKTLGPFTNCTICNEGTWSTYGRLPLCLHHAIAEAVRRKETNEKE